MNEDKIYPSMVIKSQAEAIELLKKENKELKDRINKAIEYIENQKYLDEDCYYRFKELCQIEDLLEILGKKDKE